MTRFRPCIDLHAGQVKQIVGGTLNANSPSSLQTNHVSAYGAAHFATLYRERGLTGAHVIMLGPDSEEAAREALRAWPGRLQVGGGVTADNAAEWLYAGAEKVIVTSYLFPQARFSPQRLGAVLDSLGGDKSKLVIDLSCRRQGSKWFVATNKWQTITDFELKSESFKTLEPFCSEFLVHAADNEGLQRGIDEDLVRNLGLWCSLPVTYAGGSKYLSDFEKVQQLSGGHVDLTIGSALDIFGGSAAIFDIVLSRQVTELVPFAERRREVSIAPT